MMGGSIRLHKEHGLNPTCGVCIVCGEDDGTIALLGAAYKERAPMRMVVSVDPCEKCREKYLKEGVLLLESKDGKTPTGTLVILKIEAFKRIFTAPIPENHILFIEVGLLQKLGMV